MPLTALLAGYAAGAGATFVWLMQPYELCARRSSRLIWATISTICALLWPLSWVAMYAGPYWGRRSH